MTPPPTEAQTIVHATTVAIEGKAALILGASGAGKSGLALRLIALGATLVSDDRTVLHRHTGQVISNAPEAIRGQIEARGVGILRVPYAQNVPLGLVVDLDEATQERLPEAQTRSLLGLSLPCFSRSDHGHFPEAILLYLQQSLSAQDGTPNA